MSRRGVSQQHRWPAWGWGLLALFAALSFSACIDDVVIPECFLKGTCPEAGAGGDGAHPGSGTGGDLVDVAGQGTGGVGAEAAAAGQGGEAGEPDTCTSCRVLPEHLAPACAGKPYQATFNVNGGLPPYSWRLSPQPTGWTIGSGPGDSGVGILRSSKAPDEAMQLTLVVKDARNLQLSLTLTLDVRTNCWFAYSSLESGAPELRLIDPLVAATPSVTLAHAQGAYDFQFSPDGAFLAYRYGQDIEHPKGRHLSLVDLATLKERDVPFEEDQVLSYAWSPNSEALAVAFQKDGKSYLGSVLVPAGGSEDSPTFLASTPAVVESELYWVGNDYVAFHAVASGGISRRTAYHSEFADGGFEPPADVSRLLGAGVAVQAAETGFFLINSPNTIYRDLSEGIGTDVEHLGTQFVGPSGRYTARLGPTGVPRLRSAPDDRDTAIEPEDPSETCTRLLAWATDRERLACVVDVPNGDGDDHGEIRIFDLKSSPARLQATTLQGFCPGDVDDTTSGSCLVKRQGYSYGSAQATGSPRAFSQSGRYFAFARAVPADLYVYLADLEAAPPQVPEPIYLGIASTDPNPIGFLFSSDERFLLVRRGPRLWIVELATRNVGVLRDVLASSNPCSEDFLAAPAAYCGNTRPADFAQWAADSRIVAYRSNEGLTITDLSPFPLKDVKVLPVADCADQCSGKFGFQP